MRHAKRWQPVGAAVSFLLAAIAGAVGNQLTGHLTVALAVFAGLLVAGMTVCCLLEPHGGRVPGEAHSGEAQGPYDLRGAWGVQFGSGNRQTNYFGDESGPGRRE
jgi:hypothetical protein